MTMLGFGAQLLQDMGALKLAPRGVIFFRSHICSHNIFPEYFSTKMTLSFLLKYNKTYQNIMQFMHLLIVFFHIALCSRNAPKIEKLGIGFFMKTNRFSNKYLSTIPSFYMAFRSKK